MLKAQREARAKAEVSNSVKNSDGETDISAQAFAKIKKATVAKTQGNANSTPITLEAFQKVAAAIPSVDGSVAPESTEDDKPSIDGYELRDILVAKWNVPVDIDFQRGYDGGTVYCTALPVAFGSRKCRHVTELDYLMHLQAVVEVLHRYNNLDGFLAFIQTTTRTPKPGTDSVPYRMELDADDLGKILALS